MPGPCYDDCPVTGELLRRDAQERAETARMVEGMRRSHRMVGGGEGQAKRYVPTPSGERRIDEGLRRFLEGATLPKGRPS